MSEFEDITITIFWACLVIIALTYWFYRNKRKEVAILFFSSIFSFFMMEFVLKVFYPQFLEHEKMFAYDSYLGWKFIPNKIGAIVYEGEARHNIKTNSLGFRDNPPPPANANIRKILVLGDSFVSNIAVRDNEVFTEVMEQQLENTSVLNFGVNGYGQTQEYLLLKEQLDNIKPDLVILVIFINDFADNIGSNWLYRRPIAAWSEENSTLNILSPPAYTTKDLTLRSYLHFYRNLHIYHLFSRGLMTLQNRSWGFINRYVYKLSERKQSGHENYSQRPLNIKTAKNIGSADGLPQPITIFSNQLSENTKLMYSTMEALLLKIKQLVYERDIPLVFVIAPSDIQVNEELLFSTLRDFGVESRDYDASLPNNRLMEFAEKNNLLMIDLLPILRFETKNGNILYNSRETHWNSNGNQIVALTLLEYLKNKSLISEYSHTAP